MVKETLLLAHEGDTGHLGERKCTFGSEPPRGQLAFGGEWWRVISGGIAAPDRGAATPRVDGGMEGFGGLAGCGHGLTLQSDIIGVACSLRIDGDWLRSVCKMRDGGFV